MKFYSNKISFYVVDLARIELASLQCECSVIPLDHRPCFRGRYWTRPVMRPDARSDDLANSQLKYSYPPPLEWVQVDSNH
jgi:hypothetical protein